jgi:two-component system cell cycle sensor histidine kinase/response regulator CckA
MASETILVVDDDEAVAKVTAFCLEKRGYAVLLAASVAKALETLRTHDERVDLVISDVMMPGEHGATLEQRLRELHVDIPILFMSGFPHIEAINRGMDDFVSKPFDCETLAAQVESALSRR